MKPAMPRNRRERVQWLKQHCGNAFILGFEYLTDRELKRLFEREYQRQSELDEPNPAIDPGGIADELSL